MLQSMSREESDTTERMNLTELNRHLSYRLGGKAGRGWGWRQMWETLLIGTDKAARRNAGELPRRACL